MASPRRKRSQVPRRNLWLERVSFVYGGFLKWWYPTTMGFPTKNDHFGVFWWYHHLRNPPYDVIISLIGYIYNYLLLVYNIDIYYRWLVYISSRAHTHSIHGTGIFTYKRSIFMVNVGKYTICMDSMGYIWIYDYLLLVYVDKTICSLLGSNISPPSRHFWVDDFPFPFGWDMWSFPGG